MECTIDILHVVVSSTIDKFKLNLVDECCLRTHTLVLFWNLYFQLYLATPYIPILLTNICAGLHVEAAQLG